MHVGFCFGGVLAQMLAARLWLLPQTTDVDHLMSSVVCITFGQPLIQSETLSHVTEIFPDFRNTVHVIGLVDDKFPSVLERLDSLAMTTEVRELNLVCSLIPPSFLMLYAISMYELIMDIPLY